MSTCEICGKTLSTRRSGRRFCSTSCAALYGSKLRLARRIEADHKRCCVCKETKPISEYAIKDESRFLRASACKTCHKAYRDAYYAKNHASEKKRVADRKALIRSAIKNFKATMVCAICGETHPAVLHFHHRDETTKDFTIAQAVARGLSLERIFNEIGKCDVLCANCHMKSHYAWMYE